MRVMSLRTKGRSNDPLGTRSDQVSPGPIPGLIVLLVVLTGVLTFFCSTYRIFSLPEYREGDIATSDILVPADVPMQDVEATGIRQEEARNAALPVYRHAAAQAQARVERICQLFSTLRSQLKPLAPARSPGSAWSFDKLPPEVQTNLKMQLSRLLPEPELESVSRFLAANGFSRQLQQALEQALRKANRSLVIESARDLIREQGASTCFPAPIREREQRSRWTGSRLWTACVGKSIPGCRRCCDITNSLCNPLADWSGSCCKPISPLTWRPHELPNGKRWPTWTRSSSF